MHQKMCATGRPVDEISEFQLFTVTDGGHFGFHALENPARLLKRGVGAFFYKYLKLPKTNVKRYLQKVGHGIMVLDPTNLRWQLFAWSKLLSQQAAGILIM